MLDSSKTEKRPCTYRLSNETQGEILQLKRKIECTVRMSISHDEFMRFITRCAPLIIENIQQEKKNNNAVFI